MKVTNNYTKMKLSPEKLKSVRRIAVCSLTPVFLILLTLQFFVGWPVDMGVFTILKDQIVNAPIFQPANKTTTMPNVTTITPDKNLHLVDNR
jgi:hypothetical protein